MSALRSKLIRLAHSKPELKRHILPLLAEPRVYTGSLNSPTERDQFGVEFNGDRFRITRSGQPVTGWDLTANLMGYPTPKKKIVAFEHDFVKLSGGGFQVSTKERRPYAVEATFIPFADGGGGGYIVHNVDESLDQLEFSKTARMYKKHNAAYSYAILLLSKISGK